MGADVGVGDGVVVGFKEGFASVVFGAAIWLKSDGAIGFETSNVALKSWLAFRLISQMAIMLPFLTDFGLGEILILPAT